MTTIARFVTSTFPSPPMGTSCATPTFTAARFNTVFQPHECDLIARALAAVAEGEPSIEQARILEIVADELGGTLRRSARVWMQESLRSLSEAGRRFLGDAAVVLANIDRDCDARRLWIRDALPLHPIREREAYLRTRAARRRIQSATIDFLHTVDRIARDPIVAYVSAVSDLDARKRQTLREALGLAEPNVAPTRQSNYAFLQ